MAKKNLSVDHAFILLKEHDIDFISEYKLDSNFLSNLNRADTADKKISILKDFVKEISKHSGMDASSVELKLYENTSFTKVAGVFDDKNNEIHISSNEHRTSEQLLAIVCHEFCHYFLYKKGLKDLTPRSNEVLTDSCAILLGFGKILLKGYQTVKWTVGHIGFDTLSDSETIGYLNTDEVKYGIKNAKVSAIKIRKKYNGQDSIADWRREYTETEKNEAIAYLKDKLENSRKQFEGHYARLCSLRDSFEKLRDNEKAKVDAYINYFENGEYALEVKQFENNINNIHNFETRFEAYNSLFSLNNMSATLMMITVSIGIPLVRR